MDVLERTARFDRQTTQATVRVCAVLRPLMEPRDSAAQLLELKADHLPRFVARVIDTLLAAALAHVVAPVGFFAGVTYLLIADGVVPGRSVGKAVIGLQVLAQDGRPAGLRESIVRNLPWALVFVLFVIPLIGWLLSGAVTALEGLLVLGNSRGRRLGDELANTHVVNAERTRGVSWD